MLAYHAARLPTTTPGVIGADQPGTLICPPKSYVTILKANSIYISQSEAAMSQQKATLNSSCNSVA